MTALRRALAIAAVALVATGPAIAGRYRQRPAASAQDYAGGWQAEAIAKASRDMQNAPGVTNELAPDAKATATGGPSGGVPGFSGH